jgi:hypothetical protein
VRFSDTSPVTARRRGYGGLETGFDLRILLTLALALGLCLASASPSAARLEGPGPVKACADGVDNDGDGLTDYPADPDCGSASDNSERPDEVDPPAYCGDGVDNDGDGTVDFPADPGCVSAADDDETDAPGPRCADGVDNDGDGKVDFPADPGCAGSADNDETEAAPQTAVTPLDAAGTGGAPAAPAPVVLAAPVAVAAPVAGPRLLTPFPIVRLRGVRTPAGITIDLLSVRAPSGTVVKLRCRGDRCPFVRRRVVSRGPILRFRDLGARPLVRVTLEVRATKSGYIGKFTRFRFRPGRFPLRSDACLMPGRSAPTACA